MKIRPFDLLSNLKNWTSWDYKAYKMQKYEADVCKKALENYIWHEVERESMPKDIQAGKYYLLKAVDPDNGKTLYFTADGVTTTVSEHLSKYVIAWRYIVEEE